MDKILLETESIMNQINDIEKIKVQRKERLKDSWRSLMSNMGPSDVLISTKTKKFPAHKNVLVGKENQSINFHTE